jgi:tRNA/tmRNA/rRNA uracil-C5-methylase (TrmA/RlmC/RlmD family)
MNTYKDIHCPHFAICSGCTINKDVDNPPLLKEVQNFFSEHSVPFNYYSEQVVKWRYRAKLAVRGSAENPLIGLYENGTHQVVDIPLCRVHHPSINQAVEKLKTWIKVYKIKPYNEITQEGLLRYVQCVVNRSSGRVQLSLVLNASGGREELLAAKLLWELNPDGWHSIWINWNQQRTNVIFGKEWVLVEGEEDLWETLAGAKVCFHPANFAQANLAVFERLLNDLKSSLIAKEKIVEYYAGVGVIGFSLARKAEKIECCEINPWAQISFEKARQHQGFSHISLVSGSSSSHTELLNHANVVIVDPPRKGLDRSLLSALLENEFPQELHYISCGWNSFKHDWKELTKSWQLICAQAYLFFPGTNQLEVVAKFKKNK